MRAAMSHYYATMKRIYIAIIVIAAVLVVGCGSETTTVKSDAAPQATKTIKVQGSSAAGTAATTSSE